MTSFLSILPIVIILCMGYFLGLNLPKSIIRLTSKLIGPLVLLLLLSVGYEFGHIFKNPETAGKSIYIAGVISITTTFFSCFLIYIAYKLKSSQNQEITIIRCKSISVIQPLKECVYALGMVVAGVSLSLIAGEQQFQMSSISLTDILLYILIFFVGVDIITINLVNTWKSPQVIAIPVLIIFGSFIGGITGSLILNENLFTTLALSSGYGWFTLSGIMISSKLGPEYGATALLTDLFRELIAIVLMYLYGHKYARECIGAGGATTMDSTLPIIKQTCHAESLPIALVSGFILTLLAPVMITLMLSMV